MLRKIKLYGKLAEFVGHKEFEVKADTLASAMSFLIHNFEGIDKYMSSKYYQVKVGNYIIGEDELSHPIGKKEDIHFIPVITGAGRGFGKILLGAALIGIAFLIPTTVPYANLSLGFGGFAGGTTLARTLGYVGLGLVLTGVSEMLTPVPKRHDFDSEEDPRLSFSFGGTQQTGRAGTPVPLVFGEIFTGSVVISGSVDTEQVQA